MSKGPINIDQSNVFSAHSLRELATVHPDLRALAGAVLSIWDLKVSEGHRPQHEQDLHVLEGRSFTPWPVGTHNSRPSDAVHFLPFVGGKFIGWGVKKDFAGDDVPDYEAMYHWYAFAGLVIATAAALHVSGVMESRVIWGGDWDGDWNFKEHKLRDLAHWERVRHG